VDGTGRRVHKRAKGQKGGRKRPKRGTNRQSEVVQVRSKRIDAPPKKKPVSLGLIPSKRGTNIFLKGGQTPSSPQQKMILTYIAELQLRNGGLQTPGVRRVDLALALSIPIESIKKQIQRMLKGGFLERLQAKHGRSSDGCVYRVYGIESLPEEVV